MPSTTQVRVSWALTPRAEDGDTEGVDCQRAEAHLRLLAEEELRRPARARRIRWAAELLVAIGALDEQVADRIVADFDLALAAREAFLPPASRAAGLQRRSAAVRFWPAVPASSGSSAPGPVPGRLVRLGQVILVRGAPAGGEVYLLSYAQTEAGPQLSLFVRSTRQADPSGPEAGILEQFTATDDRGTRYQMMVRDLGGGTDGWTLMLRPSPPYDPRWLDLVTAPGQPAVRVGLDRSARPPQDAAVTGQSQDRSTLSPRDAQRNAARHGRLFTGTGTHPAGNWAKRANIAQIRSGDTVGRKRRGVSRHRYVGAERRPDLRLHSWRQGQFRR
jgi:hypothetical protein